MLGGVHINNQIIDPLRRLTTWADWGSSASAADRPGVPASLRIIDRDTSEMIIDGRPLSIVKLCRRSSKGHS